jgi:hypothetical protein
VKDKTKKKKDNEKHPKAIRDGQAALVEAASLLRI